MNKFLLGSTLILFSISARAENPHNVTVKNISAFGSGCPAGSVSGIVSPDGESFSILMDSYVVESNGNRQLDRKNCEITVELNVPQGWSYQVISADYRGFVSVERGSIATHQVQYAFEGGRAINEKRHARHSFNINEFKGPISENYYIRNELHRKLAPASPCNNSDIQTLFISTNLTARTVKDLANSFAQITLDTVDGSVQTQNYKLAWRRCAPGRKGNGEHPGRGQPGRDQPGRGNADPGRGPRFSN